MKTSRQNWFERIDLDKVNSLSIACPRCQSPYHLGPIFDKDPRVCLACGTALREWNLITFIYLIDVERAPDIVKNLIDYLSKLGDIEAFEQLFELVGFIMGHDIFDE